MKNILPYMAVFAVLFACQKKATVNKAPETVAKRPGDSTGVSPKQKKINDSLAEIHDSLAFEKILQTAMARALQHTEAKFAETFEDKSLTDSVTAYVTIRGGNWFDKKKKHIIIQRKAWWVHTDIFELRNGRLIPQVHNECATLGHINDSILETNGDGHNDFAVHWYPMSGCCTRDIYDVYVYRPATHDFSAKYEFINPVFSPKEKVIRGILYGYYAGRYKYRWNGAQVDTLEFVYMDTANTNKYYITRRMAEERPPEKTSGIIRVVNGLPAEYEAISGK